MDPRRHLAPDRPDLADIDRGDHDAIVVGRLAPGQSIAKAEAEVRTVAARLAAAYPKTNKGWSVRAEPLAETIVAGSTRRAMIILMGAVGLLLLIACVNVANLMLARATGRRREMSTRLALGAARGRVVRQLLTESALLACARRRGGPVRRGVGPAPRAVALPRRHPRPDRRGDQSVRAALRACSRRC